MSDTFNHEADAWDSYEQGREDQEPGDYEGGGTFVGDPLYYHTRLKYKRMTDTTDKAVQLEIKGNKRIWLPRSVCKQWSENAVMVHRPTLLRSMKYAEQQKGQVDLKDLLPD